MTEAWVGKSGGEFGVLHVRTNDASFTFVLEPDALGTLTITALKRFASKEPGPARVLCKATLAEIGDEG